MKTREMLSILKEEGYAMVLLARQSNVSYMKLYRYVQRDGKLSYDEKARLWRFGVMQPAVSDALAIEIEEEA